jgi:hypothetical protein
LSPEKCPEKFDGKFRQKCLQLRRDLRPHVYLHLNSDLCLYPNNKLFAELNREKSEKLFPKLFRKSFASLFGKSFD